MQTFEDCHEVFIARPGGYKDRLEWAMKKDTTERVRKAQDKALGSLDYILETIPAPDFVEIVGRVGGDIGKQYEVRGAESKGQRTDYRVNTR